MGGWRAAAKAVALFIAVSGTACAGPLAQAQSCPECDRERVTLGPDGAPPPDAWRNIGRVDVTAAVDSTASFVMDALRRLRLFSHFGVAPGQVDVMQQPLGAQDSVFTNTADADDGSDMARMMSEYVTSYTTPHSDVHEIEMPDFRHKYAWQLTYRSDAPGGLAPQPDTHLDRFPGMNVTLDDAVVVGLRFEMDYGWTR